MNTRPVLIVAATLILASSALPAAEAPKNVSGPIGTYDSRLLAYAHFWSAPACRDRDALIEEARTAKAASNTLRFQELNERLVAAQKQAHLQIFSTAPADEAAAVLHDKLPALRRELGVENIVSIWDDAALAGAAATDRFDVTDRLVRELLPNPNPSQLKVMAGIRKTKPLALAEATKLADEGKL